MIESIKTLAVVALLWALTALVAHAQTGYDIYGQTTATNYFAARITASSTNMLGPWSVSQYQGQPAIYISQDTNTFDAPVNWSCISSNSQALITNGVMPVVNVTNTFLPIQGTTNNAQNIPFPTGANGIYIYFLYRNASAGAPFVSITLVGRTKTQ